MPTRSSVSTSPQCVRGRTTLNSKSTDRRRRVVPTSLRHHQFTTTIGTVDCPGSLASNPNLYNLMLFGRKLRGVADLLGFDPVGHGDFRFVPRQHGLQEQAMPNAGCPVVVTRLEKDRIDRNVKFFLILP